MKEVTKIILTLLAPLIMNGCATTGSKEFIADQEEPTVIAESVLIEQLKVNELSNVQLNAFEQRSLEVLRDLEDYLNLIKNEDVQDQFKEQARQQAEALFVDKVLINSHLNELNSSNTSEFAFNEPRITQGLEKTGNQYRGVLEFQLLEYDDDKVKVASSMKTVDFFAVKNTKSFGEQDEVVWEVLLGPINFSRIE